MNVKFSRKDAYVKDAMEIYDSRIQKMMEENGGKGQRRYEREWKDDQWGTISERAAIYTFDKGVAVVKWIKHKGGFYRTEINIILPSAKAKKILSSIESIFDQDFDALRAFDGV